MTSYEVLSVLLVAGILIHAASAAAVSSASVACTTQTNLFNFFPAGATNLPSAWAEANQTAAGATNATQLLPIALYGLPYPSLHYLPQHWTLQVGCPPPASTNATAPASRRRLEAIVTLATPAHFTTQFRLDSRLPVLGDTFTDGAASDPAPVVAFSVYAAPQLPNGAHDLTITATILAHTGALSNGATVPASDVVLTTTVSFYKLTNPYNVSGANAFSVGSGAAGVTVSIRNMWPEPVALTPSANLLVPVYHVWGTFLNDFAGANFTGEDTTDSDAPLHFFDGYWSRLPGAPANLSVDATRLANGWYSMNLETSLTSDVPTLLSLPGGDTYDQSSVPMLTVGPDGTSTSDGALLLGGMPKFNGYLVANATRVCVHRTLLNAFWGPDSKITVGQSATFSWDFSGVGNTTCQLDGAALTTDEGSPYCSTPAGGSVTVSVDDTANHTLAVTFTDVCKGKRTETVVFGASFGYVTDALCDGSGDGSGCVSSGGTGASAIKSKLSMASLTTGGNGAGSTALCAVWLRVLAAGAASAAAWWLVA